VLKCLLAPVQGCQAAMSLILWSQMHYVRLCGYGSATSCGSTAFTDCYDLTGVS
jgi:hypothetical protein